MDWKALALIEGWRIGVEDGEACLLHDDLDRRWPLDDWESACRDIGVAPE